MADLTATRNLANRPFHDVGMDYGGPFIMKESRRRGDRTNKAYLTVFVCMSTKAVHLELVTDLTTEAFLATFDRFLARRVIPSNVVTAVRSMSGLLSN